MIGICKTHAYNRISNCETHSKTENMCFAIAYYNRIIRGDLEKYDA